ncbi:hypothetical protein Tco_0909713 [Tanacetum coccineum]|uniref:Uncharacterized protein n=1 Tax=Tanacetum coccineum TaxID=301880 RepID=A0ABQ5CR84_9ASTR
MDKGLTMLSDVALTEAEQLKLVIEKSKTQTHSSHASGSGTDDGTGVKPGVPDVPLYNSDDEQISWKLSDEEDDDEVSLNDDDDVANQDDENQDDDNEQTDSDNEGDDFVHPTFSTHDDEAKQDEEVNKEDNFDPREEEMEEEATHEEDEANELYRDVNINLEGRDTTMTDALLPNQSSSVTSGFVSNMCNPRPDTGIDSIFTLNTEATSLVDVPVTTIAEPPFVSATTLPPPSTHLITHLQQTLNKKFGNRLLLVQAKNQFTEVVSSIPGIVDAYLANKMHEAIKIAVQLQFERLRDEAQAENADFLIKLDDNIKKIIKDQVKEQVKAHVSKILPKIEKLVNDQLESKVLIRSSNEAKTSYAIAANLSKLELKKILIDKMKANKSIDKSLMHMETLSLSNDVEMMQMMTKNPLLDQTGGPREDELEKTKINQCTKGKDIQDIWQNKTLPDAHGPIQPWLSSLARKEDLRELFNELMDTSLDFSAFVINQLKVDTLTTELLAGPTFELMKGSCKSLIELEYLFEEVYKATTDQLDWINLEGQQYPYDLRKPLPLIPNTQGHRVIPFDHFFNNDLEYLSGGVSSRRYATFVTKTKAADYGHIKWIENLVPNRMWSQVLVSYDKHALWGISHWGHKRQQFYGFMANRESARDVYFKRRIIAVTKIEILGVKSYQKKLNLTKPDTYRPDLKRREAYTAYSNHRGFIYQNKDKKNRLMRIDELHKFSNGTLDDIRTTFNDRLKGIRMLYLPQTIWRQHDKDNAGAMI